MAISAEDKNFLVSLYVGYFNRAPDPAGLQFWIDQVEAGRDTNTIAADFAASPEAKSLYPFLTTPDVSSPTSFITAVYANLFNRAPDAAGQAFWEAQLASGAVSPADAIDSIIKGATTAPDSTVISNKVAVGLDFATDAANTPGFTFDLNGESGNAAKDAISGVTEDAATVTAAQAATDAYLSGASNPGQSFMLTTDADNLTGTANNDVFEAPLVGSTLGIQVNTLNGTDVLDGGEGVDRLNVTLNDMSIGGFIGGVVGPNSPLISNVEQFFARAVSGSELDMTGVSGAEQLWNDRSVGTLEYNNVQNGVVIGLNEALGDTEVDYDADVLGGDFTQTIVAQGAGTATNQVDVDVDVAGGDTITGVNLNAASGVNNINLTGDAAGIADLTITGAAELMLEASGDFSSIKNVDATGYTGDLELDFSGQGVGTDLSVALGAGDDDLTVHVETLDDETALATLDGGDGEDNLTLTGFSSPAQIENVDFTNVSGFEQLTLDFPAVDLGANTLDLSETAFTSLVVDGGISGTTGGTFTVIGSEDFNTITANEAVSAGSSFTYEGFETLTLNANADVSADFVAEELTEVTLNLDAGVKFAVGSLSADALETMTVNLGEDGVLTGPMAGSADSLETVTVTGGDDSYVSYLFSGVDEESLTTIDLSGMQGADGDNTNMVGGANVEFVGEVDNDLSILIGNGDLVYTGSDLNEDDQEVFSFTGDDIGMIDISGFTSGVGGNGDRIDFSAFEAVSGLNDLEITFDANNSGNTEITAADGQFEGTITIQGTDLSTDAFNFIF